MFAASGARPAPACPNKAGLLQSLQGELSSARGQAGGHTKSRPCPSPYPGAGPGVNGAEESVRGAFAAAVSVSHLIHGHGGEEAHAATFPLEKAQYREASMSQAISC